MTEPNRSAPPAPPLLAWTWRAYLLVIVGGGLATLAVASRDAVPLYAGIPLLLASFLAGWEGSRQLSGVTLTWLASGLGPDVTITGQVQGNFGGSGVDVSVEVPRPPAATEAEPPRFERDRTSIRFTIHWTLSEPTITTLPPPSIVWRDPLGLTRRVLAGPCAPLLLDRYPPSLHGLGTIRLERTTSLPGEIHSRILGRGGEFFGLREAAQGEPLRTINWRATARVGRLLTNDYRIDRTGDLVVVLDVRPSSLGPETDVRLLGVAKAAVYGIAESMIRDKTRIGFAAFGEFLTAVPLSTGRTHRLRILRAIGAARRQEVAGPAMRCALGLRRFYPRGVTTLVVSSWTEDPSFNLVPYIHRQGFPVVLLSPSPLPLRARTGALETADELLAERLERLERRIRLSQLWAHGPVVDWEDFWSLDPLSRTFRRPAYRRAM